MLKVKSPTGVVHVVRHDDNWNCMVTLCNHHTYDIYDWKTTYDEPITCKRCLASLERREEDAFSLKDVGDSYLRRCGLKPDSTLKESLYKLQVQSDYHIYRKNVYINGYSSRTYWVRLVDYGTKELLDIMSTSNIKKYIKVAVGRILRERKVTTGLSGAIVPNY